MINLKNRNDKRQSIAHKAFVGLLIQINKITMEGNIGKPILVKIAKNLLSAQQELDELALQLALGKAEARDAFEKIKKEFRSRINELDNLAQVPTEKGSNQLKLKIAELNGLLSPGKAVTSAAFELELKKILQALKALEEEIMSGVKQLADKYPYVHEIEKFKLKAEILRLKFVLKKFQVKDSFRTGMKDAREKVLHIIKGAENKLESASEGYDDFREEIQTAYKHLKKVVTGLKG